MSEGVPSWFINKYSDEVRHLAQQRERRLAGAVSGGGVFIGDHVYFPRMGAVEMYDGTRFNPLALANAQQDMVSVQAKPKFVALGIWDPDKSKLSVNLATEYAKSATYAGFRAEDKLIVDALNLATANGVVGTNADGTTNTANITTLGDYNTVMDLDVIANAIAQLGTQEAYQGEEIVAVVPFKIKTNNALDPYMVQSKIVGSTPWDNVNWVTYERLNDQTGVPITQASSLPGGASTGVDTFIFAKSAVASDYNNEMTLINERLGTMLTDMIGKWFQGGALVKEAAGVLRIKSKYNFTLSRKAIPIADLGPM